MFWLRNKKNNFQLRTLFWGPDATSIFYSQPIEEFPIIGFYLYHVTSAGESSNWTTSGIKQVDLTL